MSTTKNQKQNSYPKQITHTNSVGRKMTPFPETVSDPKKKSVFRRLTVKFEAIWRLHWRLTPLRPYSVYSIPVYKEHLAAQGPDPTSILGKYLFGRRFEI